MIDAGSPLAAVVAGLALAAAGVVVSVIGGVIAHWLWENYGGGRR